MNFKIEYKFDHNDKQYKYDIAFTILATFFMVFFAVNIDFPHNIFISMTLTLALIGIYTIIVYRLIPRFVEIYIKE